MNTDSPQQTARRRVLRTVTFVVQVIAVFFLVIALGWILAQIATSIQGAP